MSEENYLTDAKERLQNIKILFDKGKYQSFLAGEAQFVCELSLKHLILEKYKVIQPVKSYEGIIGKHSLKLLITYIEKFLNIKFSDEFKFAIYTIDGYYYTTRYRDDSYMELDKNEIEYSYTVANLCIETVESILNTTPEIKSLNLLALSEHITIDQFINKYAPYVTDNIMKSHGLYDCKENRAYLGYVLQNKIKE